MRLGEVIKEFDVIPEELEKEKQIPLSVPVEEPQTVPVEK